VRGLAAEARRTAEEGWKTSREARHTLAEADRRCRTIYRR
jgi:hypothetical protein